MWASNTTSFSIFDVEKNNQSMLKYDGFVNNMWMIAELTWKGSFGRDGMIVGFTTTSAISVYLQRCEFESRSWRDVLDTILDTILYDKVCQ